METYLAKRPHLKEGTKKGHIRRYNQILEHLKKTEDIESIDVNLLNGEKYINLIKSFIETKNLPSKCSYINTLLFIISPIKAQPENNLIETYSIWKKIYYEIDAKNLNKNFRKKKINTKLKSKYKKNIDNINKKSEIIDLIQDNFFQYQYYLMLCLHSYIYPVRTEYSEMMVCSWDYYRDLNDEEKNINHYLINDKRKTKRIVFGKDARKNKMKKNLIIVPKELCVIINTFIDMRNILFKFTIKDSDTIPLFYKHTRFKNGDNLKSGLDANLYSKNFINFMDRNLGKKVGVSLMRSIFTSYYRRGEKSLQEKKEICEIMNHSPHTQEANYLKLDQ